jgi:hypothetical protein
MKITQKVYTVELTIKEVELLVRTLETEYKYRAKAPDVRELRNAFAGILNRTYSGADA